MNKEQEDLIATGLWILIKNSDKIKESEKQVWMMDYDKLFGEEETKEEEPCCEMPEEEEEDKDNRRATPEMIRNKTYRKDADARDEVNGICKCGHSKEIHRPDCEGIKPDSNQRKICGCQKFVLNKENGK